jgi:hypothetical protein
MTQEPFGRLDVEDRALYGLPVWTEALSLSWVQAARSSSIGRHRRRPP